MQSIYCITEAMFDCLTSEEEKLPVQLLVGIAYILLSLFWLNVFLYFLTVYLQTTSKPNF